VSIIAKQNFTDVSFLTSVFDLKQLPAPDMPEIAFAGRSNVGKSSLINRLIKRKNLVKTSAGKSSLINRLIKRKNLVKTSAKPGKTQSLNFFLLANSIYLVDLPGYGYAKVSKKVQASWQILITGYLESRENLKCVIVIVDLRHAMKIVDLQLVDWLRSNGVPSGFGVSSPERLLFSAKTGMGRDSLIQSLDSFLV
jgi:GTP-binding protein